MSNKWYNHSYDNSGNDNNGIHNSSFDTTFEYNHIFFLSKSLILPVVVNIRDVNVPCSMSLYDKSASFTNHGVVERTALSAYTRGYVEGISSNGQPYCSLTALQNSCLIKLEPISRRGQGQAPA